jgi:RNA polymerase sigma factor (sigma-70 family)
VHDSELGKIVAAAAGGDQRAWSELVGRYAGLVLATARSFRLPTHEAEDVSQLTWLLLAMHIRSVREPQAIGSWLVTTTKREAVRLLKRRHREYPVEGEHLDLEDRGMAAVDDEVLREELRAQVRGGFARLADRCQQLLRMLARDPPASYHEISAELDMPPGSIGPTRARCLQQLRQLAGL